MNPWVTPAITIFAIIIGALGGYLGFRIQFERFLARDTEREKHWFRWQESISKDVEELKSERNMHVRIQQCEEFIAELREWKHEKVDPYIRATGQIKERVDRIEKRQ